MTPTLSSLQETVLTTVQGSAPLEFNGSKMDGRPGCTAIGACIQMGHSGSVPAIYNALDELVQMGLVKKGCSYTDSIYYV